MLTMTAVLGGLEKITPQKSAAELAGQRDHEAGDDHRDERCAATGASRLSADPAQASVMPRSSSSPPVIAEPRSCGVTRLRVELADQPAAQDDLDPVGQADQLVEVGRDQQHRQALAAGRP